MSSCFDKAGCCDRHPHYKLVSPNYESPHHAVNPLLLFSIANERSKTMTAADALPHSSPPVIDQPSAVRHGEALDQPALTAYLAAQRPDLVGELHITQFPSGYSNLTYLIRIGQQELILRRPPFGVSERSAHDMGREFRVLSGLQRVYTKAPRPLFYCADEKVLGAPFYGMERIRGVILRATTPPGVELTPPLMKALSLTAIETLAEIHALDVNAAGLADLGRPSGYIERQLHGWQRRYASAQTATLPRLEAVMAWLNAHQPSSSGATLIHNDFKYDNLVLDPQNLTKVIAVLDWEMCTVGDPLMDLGTTLGYWIEANDPPSLKGMFGLTALPGNAHRGELVEHYQAVSGRNVADPLFYYVYGLFKIAVIIQQIYYRYRQGTTQDQRFAQLDQVVRDCADLATTALEKNRIYHLS
jgi:aminoglycoside phosphotransferase (APT) family kinase protein